MNLEQFEIKKLNMAVVLKGSESVLKQVLQQLSRRLDIDIVYFTFSTDEKLVVVKKPLRRSW